MKTLLRYNSRHQLMLSRKHGLQLNPTSWSSDDTLWDCSEPLWLFRLRQRVFCHAGAQRCGRRGENPVWSNRNHGLQPLPDTWDLGPDGNRTCSYCGSIHPDDMMALCRKTLVDDRYGVESTDKGYKYYVRQPAVKNASQGAIKFYMAHAPEAPTREEQELFTQAVRTTNERFRARYASR
jgi:hypothetical protein